MKKETGAVLVVGAGIGGIKASFEVAELGYRVYLIDTNPFIGGTLSQLDRQFPTNKCCMCHLLPTLARKGTSHFCLRKEFYHQNVTPLPGSSIAQVSGKAGNFQVTVKTDAAWIKPELCINCGACVDVCPVDVNDEFNGELITRKAVYAKYPTPVPNIYAIDKTACTRCGKCVEICPTRAIDLDIEDRTQNINVGSVILASGFEEFDPKLLMQYGHGRYPDVLTSVELERMFSGYGPGKGDIYRPSDGSKPKRIAFLQCVGSRDQERDYCSAACCMYALKEAMVIREINPEIDISFFYMDARAYGKGYHQFLESARDDFNVTLTRSRVPVVKGNPASKKLAVKYLDETGNQHLEEFDLIILSIGQAPPVKHAEIGKIFDIKLNKWGFCVTDQYSQVETSRDGIYVCGSFSEPKDIPETIAQASSAAFHAAACLRKSGLKPVKHEASSDSKPVSAKYDHLSEKMDWENRTAVFICQCGEEISKFLDTAALAEYGKSLNSVVHCEEIRVLCSAQSLEKVKQRLIQSNISRVVFAACVPYHYLRLFEETAVAAGLDPGYIKVVNIREHAAWPHSTDKKAALSKAKSILAMGVEFARTETLRETGAAYEIQSRALVIGGGAAGMSAAIALAEYGIEVDLVEKGNALGGQLSKIHFAPSGNDPQEILKSLVGRVHDAADNNGKIHLHLNTQVASVSGKAGDFQAVLKNGKGESQTLKHGAIIVATGGEEHIPVEYNYDKSERILTQQEFKEKVVAGEIDLAKLNSVVMIQCVESREGARPYCSRICCTQSITNALKIKEANPEAEITIFNRDIMTYGFREQYYTKSREMGVAYVRYDLNQKPVVEPHQDHVKITAYDPVLQAELELEADILLLSSGIDAKENSELAELLNVELDSNGFFQEAEVKFRPVDFHSEGIYVAGLAHSPRFIEESITQGVATAARAATILTKTKMPAPVSVAEVNQYRCSGCELCIPACVYNARIKDPETNTVVIREALCQACGACAMVCPNHASKLRGFRDKQMYSVIDVALGE
ncbi:CoB--CoM heterodisulfide reductase iron-sulfur subunit A family protein [candidate division KSB1 bacterium]|nr:CoB--CoM heterodisulfide reductase iron-sulfur subunit A family protein [candidate division KSB1 bacterium]